MAYINGNKVNFSSYVVDEGLYYNKEQTAKVISNPNLLINGDFRVNQRNQTTYSITRQYTVDGWQLYYGSLVVNADGSVTHTANNTWQGIIQYIANPSRFAGKTLTISANSTAEGVRNLTMSYIKNGETTSVQIGGKSATASGNTTHYTTVTIPNDITDNDKLILILYTSNANQSVTWHWAKLEVGSVATAFSPKTYEEELAACQVIDGGICKTHSNPNLLINADFRVNQRGQDVYGDASNTTIQYPTSIYSADRWFFSRNYTGTFDVVNKTLLTGTNGTYANLYQFIETDISALIGRTLIFSLDIQSTISSQISIGYKRENTYYNFSTTINTSNIKNKKSVTATISSDVLSTDKLYVAIVCNGGNNDSCTFDNCKLEVGSVATAFSPRSYAEELALCQRYYIEADASGLGISVADGTAVMSNVSLPTTLRKTATYKFVATGNPTLIGNGVTFEVDLSNISFISRENNVVKLMAAMGDFSRDGFTPYYLNAVTISVDAEIY